MLLTSVHQLQTSEGCLLPRLWAVGHCIHLCQSENSLSITWLMKTMPSKVCVIAKTPIPYHIGYQMICATK